jgi:hypothetical protein
MVGTARVVAVCAAMLVCPAMAEEEDEIEELPRSPLSAVIFGSLDAGPTKTLLSMGWKRSWGGGPARSGFRTIVKSGSSVEQADRLSSRGIAYKSEKQVLLGYEWRIGDSFVSLYAGSDFDSEIRQTARAIQWTTRYGGRLQADLWVTPTTDTMLQAGAYVSSLNGRIWGRLAPGWRLAQDIHAGPEIEGYRERDYRKVRLGLHLTGLRLLGVNWRVSGGWQRTSDRPSEPYATVGLHWQR